MITIEEAKANIGRGVVYTRYEAGSVTVVFTNENTGDTATGSIAGRRPVGEDGVITSVNDAYVFVRYTGDAGSKATRPGDLDWLAAPK